MEAWLSESDFIWPLVYFVIMFGLRFWFWYEQIIPSYVAQTWTAWPSGLYGNLPSSFFWEWHALCAI